MHVAIMRKGMATAVIGAGRGAVVFRAAPRAFCRPQLPREPLRSSGRSHGPFGEKNSSPNRTVVSASADLSDAKAGWPIETVPSAPP